MESTGALDLLCKCIASTTLQKCKKKAIVGTNFCYIHTGNCINIPPPSPSPGQLLITSPGKQPTQDPIKTPDPRPHFVYKKTRHITHSIPAGEDKITKYLNDIDRNCNKNRSIHLPNIKTPNWDMHIKPHLEKMCDILPLDKVKGVFGPYTYTEFKLTPVSYPNKHSTNSYGEERSFEEGGMDIKIGIFGEYHNPFVYKNIDERQKFPAGPVGVDRSAAGIDYTGVLPMHSFLKSLLLTNLSSPNKKYDFYMETGFINKNNPIHEYTREINFSLHLLKREFERCFQVDKSLCEYNNLRAHYIDVRNFLYAKRKLIMELPALTAEEPNPPWAEFKVPGDPGYELIWDTFIEELNIPDARYFKELIEIPLIHKQLLYNRYADEIKKFIYNEFIQLRSFFSINIGKIKPGPTDIMNANKYLIAKKALSIDIYTLGRITKNASIMNQKNIIIYAGNAHSEVYVRFLIYINAKLQHSITSSPEKEPVIYFMEKEKMPLLFEGIKKPAIGQVDSLSTPAKIISFLKNKYNSFYNYLFRP